MSLVGTRPPTVDEWDKYELHHRARLATKPGLTGMWQVSGRSNITDLEEALEVTDKKSLRTLMLNVIRGDYRNSLAAINLALNSEDCCTYSGAVENFEK